MDISRQFINNPTRVWLAILLLGVGGLFALLNIGRLEDPAFTIKTAVIVTHYPGASAQQVEEEVTLPLENAIQQLPSLDNVSSISSNGLSQITVNIASQYHSSELPQIWDELRRRVGDASRLFPPGVVPPFVNDDFGDVFGFFFAISGDSFTNPELVRYAEQLRRELVLVPGVGKVAIGGVIPQQINVDISLAKMAARGSPSTSSPQSWPDSTWCPAPGRSALAANRSASTPPVSFRASMSWEICWSALTAPAPPPDCGILLRCRAG